MAGERHRAEIEAIDEDARRTESLEKAARQYALAPFQGWGRDPRVADAFRASRSAEGTLVCDVCGWPGCQDQDPGLVAVHHIVPLCCRGADAEHNMMVLCPNHHAIADRLGNRVRRQEIATHREYRWTGPTTSTEVFEAIRLFEKDASRRCEKPRGHDGPCGCDTQTWEK